MTGREAQMLWLEFTPEPMEGRSLALSVHCILSNFNLGRLRTVGVQLESSAGVRTLRSEAQLLILLFIFRWDNCVR